MLGGMGPSRVRLLACACLLTIGAVATPVGTGVAVAAPTAILVAPDQVLVGESVTLESRSTPFDELTPILSTQWTLPATWGQCDPTPICTVAAPPVGPGTVRLTVIDMLGTASVEKTISVVETPPPPPPPPPNQPPTAAFAALPTSPLPGDEVTVVSYSEDPDGGISALAWDLDDDGSFDDGTKPVETHKFAAPGPKTITLRVTDNDGAISTGSLTLTVRQPGAPVATPTPMSTALLPKLLTPFPVVTVSGRVRPTGTKIDLLAVRAPQGSRVSVRCRGKRCRLKPLSKVVGRGQLRLKAAERLMPAGVALEVLVRRGDRIGKFTRLKIRRNARPRRTDGCLWPGTAQLAPCPRG
jgi:hypothetical protein